MCAPRLAPRVTLSHSSDLASPSAKELTILPTTRPCPRVRHSLWSATPPPLCKSYANLRDYYSPYAHCSLDKGVACAQHIQLLARTCACAWYECTLTSAHISKCMQTQERCLLVKRSHSHEKRCLWMAGCTLLTLQILGSSNCKFYCLWQVHPVENLPQAAHTKNRVKTTQIRATYNMLYISWVVILGDPNIKKKVSETSVFEMYRLKNCSRLVVYQSHLTPPPPPHPIFFGREREGARERERETEREREREREGRAQWERNREVQQERKRRGEQERMEGRE